MNFIEQQNFIKKENIENCETIKNPKYPSENSKCPEGDNPTKCNNETLDSSFLSSCITENELIQQFPIIASIYFEIQTFNDIPELSDKTPLPDPLPQLPLLTSTCTLVKLNDYLQNKLSEECKQNANVIDIQFLASPSNRMKPIHKLKFANFTIFEVTKQCQAMLKMAECIRNNKMRAKNKNFEINNFVEEFNKNETINIIGVDSNQPPTDIHVYKKPHLRSNINVVTPRNVGGFYKKNKRKTKRRKTVRRRKCS